MSQADDIINKNLSLAEIEDMLKAKMQEPRYRNSLTTNESVGTVAMLYLVVKAIRSLQ